MLLINGELITKPLKSNADLNTFGYWKVKDASLVLKRGYQNATLDLVVENFGRINYGALNQFNQKKGIWQDHVYINDNAISNWDIYPLEFKKNWTKSLNNWQPRISHTGPALHRSLLKVQGEPKDTFLDMRNWRKGVVIVNGFVLSRYFKMGPQQTAYLPGPFLKSGDNEIIVFEHFQGAKEVKFSSIPVFETFLEF